MTTQDTLVGAALALIDCYYNQAQNQLIGWEGLRRLVFADYILHQPAAYDEASSCVGVPVLLFAEKFDPMRTDQEGRRAWLTVIFTREGARVAIDLESPPPVVERIS